MRSTIAARPAIIRVELGRFILVGADPRLPTSHHGGVLTLSASLVSYALARGHVIDVVNTLRRSLDELPTWRRLGAGVHRAGRLFRCLTIEHCDGVIIFAGAGMSFYERILLSAICRLFRVNDFFIVVDGWFLESLRHQDLRLLVIRQLLKIPHRLAASGTRWREAFQNLGVESSRIVSVHFWLADSFTVSHTAKEIPHRPIRFLFIGWMIKEKGIGEIVAAIRELKRFREFSVTFIGGGALLQTVRQTISESGWSDSIFALGWVSNTSARFKEVLDSSDIFVLPSYAEGFPMSLIEALSRGLPAICSDVGGISDSLHDGVNGYLIPPGQAEALKIAMLRYIENPALVAEHSRAALSIVKANHNAEHNCELIFAALH